jgi:GTP-binding protein
MKDTLPVVVVAGRPNVGKSTLVNRFVGRQIAIVERNPGVTRDRLELQCDWAGTAFRLVDTGGLVEGGDSLEDKVSEQSIRAVNGADIVLFVLDATTGVTGEDAIVAGWLRRVRDKVIVVANKVDNERREAEAWELASLGLGTPIMVSALHGRGVGDLLDTLVGRLGSLAAGSAARGAGAGAGACAAAGAGQDSPVDMGHMRPIREGESIDETPLRAEGGHVEASSRSGNSGSAANAANAGSAGNDRAIAAVAIVGRPNVGKSTLFNRLVGEDRSVVHDLPGTTRDAIDTVVDTEVGSLRLVDTAGMRRRAREGDAPEYFSLVRSLRALDRSDVALLVLDATEGVTHQDQRLAERVDASGSPAVILLNKWDLLSTEERLDLGDQVAEKLAFLGYAPVLRISAKTGLGVHRLLPVIDQAIAAYHRRIPTSRLNEALKAAQSAHPDPGARILYAVQGAIDPPTVTLFATRRLPPPYLRYLERSLRERFDLGPTPIEMRVRVRAQR